MNTSGDLQITYRPLGDVHPDPRNRSLVDGARRRRRPPTTAVAALLTAAVPCAAVLGAARGAYALAAAYFALTLCLGAAGVASLAGFQGLAPERLRGRANAAYFAVVTLVGLGLGPPLVGLLNDGFRLGGRDQLALALALTVVAVALPAAVWSGVSGRWWMGSAARAAGAPV